MLGFKNFYAAADQAVKLEQTFAMFDDSQGILGSSPQRDLDVSTSPRLHIPPGVAVTNKRHWATAVRTFQSLMKHLLRRWFSQSIQTRRRQHIELPSGFPSPETLHHVPTESDA